MTQHRDRTFAATSLLARMFTGISQTALAGVDEDAPDLSARSITATDDGYGVQAELELPTGDRYLVTVEWIKDESP